MKSSYWALEFDSHIVVFETNFFFTKSSGVPQPSWCFILRHLYKNTWTANTNLTIPQLCKSVQRFWRYEVTKNITYIHTYIQDTREKHNFSLAVGKKRSSDSGDERYAQGALLMCINAWLRPIASQGHKRVTVNATGYELDSHSRKIYI